MKFLLATLMVAACILPLHAADYFKDNQVVDDVVNAGRVQAQGEVEVVEFFWYGCPHCAVFEPYIQGWVKELPPQVKFIRLPASWNAGMANQQRLYFTLEALNRLDLHNKVLQDIHKNKIRLNSPEQIAQWASAQKINVNAWRTAYNSQAVTERAAFAQAAFRRFELSWVPAVVINGKRVLGFTPDILKNAEQAVQQELRIRQPSTSKGL